MNLGFIKTGSGVWKCVKHGTYSPDRHCVKCEKEEDERLLRQLNRVVGSPSYTDSRTHRGKVK